MDFDKVINRKGTYCTQWDYIEDRFGYSDLLPFSISDTDFAVPETVLDELKTRLEHGVFGYTRWNHDDFKNAISQWFITRFNTDLTGKEILYSPSVMYSVSLLIEIHSKEKEGIVIQTPAYDAFYNTIKASNRKIVENPLNYDDGQYAIDFKDLEAKLAEPNNRILLMCSPHNPTGKVWTKEELNKIVEMCKKYDVYLISDEIHMDVLREGVTHHPIVNFDYEKIALVSSGSKTFNFPGLIFSYAVLANEKDAGEFNQRLKQKHGLSSASIMGLHATISAYNTSHDWVDEFNSYINDNIKYVKNFLAEHFPSMHIVDSKATYLMWIDISKYPLDMNEIQERLIHIGKVAIMDGSIYGGNGKKFLRLNVGCPKEKLIDGMERLKVSLETR